MTSVTTPTGLSLEAVTALSEWQAEPSWLRALRRQAWETFESVPWPDASQEEWRRVNLKGLQLEEYAPYLPAGTPLPAGLHAAVGARAHVAQGNSTVVRAVLPEELQRQGVIFTSLEEAVRRYPELVEPHLGQVLSPVQGKIEALHTALWSGGAFLYVPRNVAVAEPLYLTVWADAPGLALLPHTLVVAEEGSALTLYEEHLSATPQAGAFAAPAAEVIVGDGARVHYTTLQGSGEAVREFGTRRAVVGREAHLEWTTVVLGAQQSWMRLQGVFAGPGAEARLHGLYLPGSEQEFHLVTLQEHQAPHTQSDLYFKGALRDQARSVYHGVIRVHPGAQRANGYQQNRNLLLSGHARADSIPILEIEANDVKCSHGATVGQVDPDQLFYLTSRGLPRPEAEQLLVEGFFREVLDALPDEAAREYVVQAVAAKVAPGGRKE